MVLEHSLSWLDSRCAPIWGSLCHQDHFRRVLCVSAPKRFESVCNKDTIFYLICYGEDFIPDPFNVLAVLDCMPVRSV